MNKFDINQSEGRKVNNITQIIYLNTKKYSLPLDAMNLYL